MRRVIGELGVSGVQLLDRVGGRELNSRAGFAIRDRACLGGGAVATMV